MTEKKKCSVCNGTGWFSPGGGCHGCADEPCYACKKGKEEIEIVECPRCFGERFVLEEPSQPEGYEGRMKECQTCEGYGEVSKKWLEWFHLEMDVRENICDFVFSNFEDRLEKIGEERERLNRLEVSTVAGMDETEEKEMEKWKKENPEPRRN